MIRSRALILLLLPIVAGLAACAPAVNERATLSISIDHDSLAARSSNLTGNSGSVEIPDDYCYALHISGPGLSQGTAETASPSCSYPHPAPGRTEGFFSKGDQAQFDIFPALLRKIDLLAIPKAALPSLNNQCPKQLVLKYDPNAVEHDTKILLVEKNANGTVTESDLDTLIDKTQIPYTTDGDFAVIATWQGPIAPGENRIGLKLVSGTAIPSQDGLSTFGKPYGCPKAPKNPEVIFPPVQSSNTFLTGATIVPAEVACPSDATKIQALLTGPAAYSATSTMTCVAGVAKFDGGAIANVLPLPVSFVANSIFTLTLTPVIGSVPGTNTSTYQVIRSAAGYSTVAGTASQIGSEMKLSISENGNTAVIGGALSSAVSTSTAGFWANIDRTAAPFTMTSLNMIRVSDLTGDTSPIHSGPLQAGTLNGQSAAFASLWSNPSQTRISGLTFSGTKDFGITPLGLSSFASSYANASDHGLFAFATYESSTDKVRAARYVNGLCNNSFAFGDSNPILCLDETSSPLITASGSAQIKKLVVDKSALPVWIGSIIENGGSQFALARCSDESSCISPTPGVNFQEGTAEPSTPVTSESFTDIAILPDFSGGKIVAISGYDSFTNTPILRLYKLDNSAGAGNLTIAGPNWASTASFYPPWTNGSAQFFGRSKDELYTGGSIYLADNTHHSVLYRSRNQGQSWVQVYVGAPDTILLGAKPVPLTGAPQNPLLLLEVDTTAGTESPNGAGNFRLLRQQGHGY